MNAVLAFVVLLAVASLSIWYALAERNRRIEADDLLQAYMDGDKLRRQLGMK